MSVSNEFTGPAITNAGSAPADIELVVDGRRRTARVTGADVLMTVLRDQLGCGSVREGCGVGACGACTVLVDGRSVSSCLALAVRHHGAEVTTTEGLPDDDPVVRAYVAERAMQCGYCIPGFVLMTHELLADNPDPSEAEIAEQLEGNLCRCGAYVEIKAAAARAARDGARAGAPHAAAADASAADVPAADAGATATATATRNQDPATARNEEVTG
ncbi:MAG: (2Fe-2S)-binding protein [Micromonosporaceae bacterium]